MPAPRTPRLLVLAVATAAALPVLVAPPAVAEEPPASGDTVVGELVQGYADPAPEDHLHDASAEDGGTLLSWVQTAPGEAVRVPTEDVEDVETGATVEVVLGEPVADEAAQEGLEPALDVLAAEVVAAPEEPTTAPATTPVNHPVTVVMLQPAGAARDGTSLQQVVDVVNGAVADFWEQQTGGAVRFGVVRAVDWGLPATVGCDRPFELWQQAAERAQRWTWDDNAHLLVYVPSGASGCEYGLGTIGQSLGDGGLAYVKAAQTSVIAHEFGHNLGLGHSSAVQCDGVVDAGTCRTVGYGDLYDVMGLSWGRVGALNVAQAAELGLVEGGEAIDVTPWYPPHEMTLAPVSTGSRPDAALAVRLVDADDTSYWLEYRQASGQDTWLGTADNRYGLQQGVLLRRSAAGPDTSLLFDATPSARAGWSGDQAVALPAGTPVRIAGGRFTVTVLGVTDTAARVRVDPASPTEAFHAASGGDAGPQGPTVVPETCNDQGRCEARYENAAVTWSRATGTHAVMAPELAVWDAARERLGFPTRSRSCGLPAGGCFQAFEGGGVYTSSATGTRAVTGDVYRRWAAQGWERGPLGYPTGDAVCGLRDGGCFQRFQGGSVYWSPATGARILSGPVRDRWAAQGWERGQLGYPTRDVACGLRDGGCFQHFQGGSVYSSSATGARLLTTPIRDRWAALGWENGRLGYPVVDQVCGLPDSGCFVHFQGGSVYASRSAGVHDLAGPVRDRWAASGWERGPLGYPTTDLVCGLRSGGCFQHFQGGSVYWSPGTGARVVNGTIRDAWAAQGWENGTLGYPVTDPVCGLPQGGCFVHFQGGSVYATATTGAHAVAGAIRDAWAGQGWERGTLGYPAEGARAVPGGATQRFQGGTLFHDHRTGQVRRV